MDYKQASLTADVVIFRVIDGKREVLLIQRDNKPDNVFSGYWAIVGGFVDLNENETVEAAAYRELKEETSIDLIDLFGDNRLKFFKFYDAPLRDTRARVVSFVYMAEFSNGEALTIKATAGDDAADAKWFDINDLPYNLAFDHAQILEDMCKHLQVK